LTKYIADRRSSDHPNEIVGTKGPVFATAIIAGVMAAKKTADLIPFCHPVALEDCKITITPQIQQSATERSLLTIDCAVKTTHKTGVEMEAIVGATNAAMCIYDMLKAVSHDIIISEIKLMSKTGGKSDFKRTSV
jgi:cyclic pyranopterin phosphate synthase